MTLGTGTRLGPYEIIAPLGAGGMGEVYRARDTRLDRSVAVKVLPEHLSKNPEVRARFEREARSVSSLNHPHICTLFDVGREGDTDYLVMELVEGETLFERLGKGVLPAADVLRLGAQIADALDRAHRAGVVHRDLKPGNVMLTKSGAKLMDFGLARATGLTGPGGGSGASMGAMTQSPTMGQPLTAEGTIVGTFQYMSPEQLEGREADARSDLWALGCVLYEMATGRRAFEGRSQASLISAIMSSEPPPVSQIAPLAPPALDRLVARCLAKDPDDRWQTARDLMHELRAIGIAPASVSSAAAVLPLDRRLKRPSVLPWAVAAALFLATLALGFLLLSRGERATDGVVKLSLLPPEGTQLTIYSSLTTISPDGRNVAYCGLEAGGPSLALYLQPLDAVAPVRLMPVESITQGFWAPDGLTLGILDQVSRRLVTIPVSGGSPTLVCETQASRGGTWNQDGVILYAPSTSGPLFRVPASGGDPVQASWPDSTGRESSHRFPFFLPDGDHFLFVSLPPEPEGFPVSVGSLGSREVKKILVAGSAATYAEPGYLLFRRSGKVMAQPFDAGALELKGDPVAIADAPPESDLDAEPVACASKDGKVILLDARAPETRLQWLDAAGAPAGTLALPPGDWGRPVLSPDDRFAVVPKEGDLWSVDLIRSVAVRLTSSETVKSNPVWSPDGSRIAFREGRGREEILIMNADGSGQAELLSTTEDLFKWPEDWTSKGLVFGRIGPQSFRDLWMIGVGEGGKPSSLVQNPFSEFQAQVSPDERWIAYLSNEAGIEDVYIQSFPAPGHKVRVSTGGASRMWWMPGGDEIWYRSADRKDMVSVKLDLRGDDLTVYEPRVLFPLTLSVIGNDVTHDGRRILANVAEADRQGSTVRVILNWTALVKR